MNGAESQSPNARAILHYTQLSTGGRQYELFSMECCVRGVMILAMNGTVIAFVLASAVLHASWNFAVRRARGDLMVLWLSLMLAGVVGIPAAIAYALWYPPQAAGWWYMLASCVLNALFFSLLGKAYEDGEISLVYPVCRGTGVALTGAIALAMAIDPLRPLALAGILAVVAGILLIGLGPIIREKLPELIADRLPNLMGFMREMASKECTRENFDVFFR